MSSSKKLLVIIGVTGQQGGSVVQLFSSDHSLSSTWRIRGVTRNPSKPTTLPSSVELVAGDLDDAASLEKAFSGADAIFAVTDFWNFTTNHNSPVHSIAAGKGLPLNIAAAEYEIQQGKNIADAAAKIPSLQRLVISTLADSKKWSKGEITTNYHFDSKDAYCQYLKDTYPSLAKVTSYVHVGYYLSNVFAFPALGPKKDSSGTYLLPTMGLPNGHPIPFVNPPHDLGYFVEALINKSPAETVMLGYCKSITYEEYATLWGKTLGVKARPQQVSIEGFVEAGMPEWLAQEVNASGLFTTKFGWAGGEPGVKSPEECGVDMSRLTSVEEWIKGQEWKL